MIEQWTREFLNNASTVFATKHRQNSAKHADEDALFSQIGHLKTVLDWLN